MSLTKKTTIAPNPLDQVVKVFDTYMDAKPHYMWGAALWALHTHVFMQYDKSPRLTILSPVPNCGKSTVLNILGAMAWESKRVIDPSEASLLRLANKHSLLIDEVDNMSIVKRMRSILNDGHSFGGSVSRVQPDKTVVNWPVYGPVALAGIGKVPATLMSRSVVIRLHRSSKPLERFSPREHYYASQLHRWAEHSGQNLDPDPKMPLSMVGRNADKWRPLIAIADYFGRGHLVRSMALTYMNESATLDIRESVLRDTQKVFTKTKAKIITTDYLCETLREDKDGDFEVDYTEHKVTKRVLGNILVEFQIRSRPYRHQRGPVQRCWFREDFEEMWTRYS